jgi:hypothetical protein
VSSTKAVFFGYLVLIVLGLAYFAALGLVHQ